ncbi:PDR ABC-type transporter family protein, partial [Tanacetum coccineum]
ESIYKRPPTGFELFLHTHTSGHDKITFINEKSKTIHDNVLRLRQEREGNQASTESQVDETTLYIEVASGSENTDGGDAHQRPNTSNSQAGESKSQAGEREEDDHDSCMIVSS